MGNNIRTDLAIESHELWRRSARDTTKLRGVAAREEQRGSFRLTTVEVLDDEGAAALCKPIGKYLTLELDALMRREENAFPEAASTLSELLRGLLPGSGGILVVGLGNRAITPDAVGPCAVDDILVTRHLRERLPEQFGDFREVSAFCAGVLGTTGVESADIIRSLCALLSPACVIAVDALAAMNSKRLCRTIQLSDTGIVPGSGVGNSRCALNRETVGSPVISIGAPTVVDAAALISELTGRPAAPADGAPLIVTPKDIDKNVRDLARLIAYGINLALHDGLSSEDIDMLIG